LVPKQGKKKQTPDKGKGKVANKDAGRQSYACSGPLKPDRYLLGDSASEEIEGWYAPKREKASEKRPSEGGRKARSQNVTWSSGRIFPFKVEEGLRKAWNQKNCPKKRNR